VTTALQLLQTKDWLALLPFTTTSLMNLFLASYAQNQISTNSVLTHTAGHYYDFEVMDALSWLYCGAMQRNQTDSEQLYAM